MGLTDVLQDSGSHWKETMIRKTVHGVALALVLALPSAVQSQDGAQRRRSGQAAASPGAQEFLSAFQAIRDYGLLELSDSTLWYRAVDGLIGQIDDPYAQAFSPDEYDDFQESNTGNYAGIGVQITTLNEMITVTAVFRDTPAEESGLQVGDRIIGGERGEYRGMEHRGRVERHPWRGGNDGGPCHRPPGAHRPAQADCAPGHRPCLGCGGRHRGRQRRLYRARPRCSWLGR